MHELKYYSRTLYVFYVHLANPIPWLNNTSKAKFNVPKSYGAWYIIYDLYNL